MEQVYTLVTSEKEKMLVENFKDWDTEFCQLFYNASFGTPLNESLTKYYNQHRRVIEFYKKLINVNKEIIEELQSLQVRQDVEKSELNTFQNKINTQLIKLNDSLEMLTKNVFNKLPNIDNWEEFKKSIVNEGTFKQGKEPIFENGEFDRIMNELQSGINHMQRIDLSSIGVILDLHENIIALNNKK